MNGIFLGRMSPIHNGHHSIINIMISECHWKNCIVILGSSNAPTSVKNIFSVEDRKMFFNKIFDSIPIFELPDYNNDKIWSSELNKIISNSHLRKWDTNVHYGGCVSDIGFFLEDKRDIRIVNRFSGSTPILSATEIREKLINGESIKDFVHPIIHDDVVSIFNKRWSDLNLYKNT